MATNNKTIAKNTMMLYFRMFLVIAIQLITVPVVMRTLGVDNYGLYGVVAGVVTMFSFAGSTLATGTQRYMAFALGRNDTVELKKTFDANVTVYGLVCIVTFVLLEAIGVWFVNTKMVIPEGRMWVANWVFQLSILNLMVNFMSTPFNAAIIAHEKMNVFAYVSIFECVMKLVVVYVLLISPIDNLLMYAILQSFVVILIWAVYKFYCAKHFPECRGYKFEWDKPRIKDLFQYAMYNVIGTLSGIMSSSGINIVQNLFFGTLVNAAHGVAGQISGVVSQFTSNVRLAARPQIIKNYASGEKDEMWQLLYQSGKLTFYLFIFISVPAILELKYVLGLWLDVVPDHTVGICVLMLASSLVLLITAPLNAVFQAANRLKRIQLYSSSINLLTVPISYVVLLVYDNVYIPYLIMFLLGIFSSMVTLIIGRKDIELDVRKYFKDVIIKELLCFLLGFAGSAWIIFVMEESFLRLVITCVTSVVVSAIVMWLIGLTKSEKDFVIRFVNSKILRKGD